MKPSWRQATAASGSSKLEVQTAPQAPSQKTCNAPVAKPLTSTLLTRRAAPSSPARSVSLTVEKNPPIAGAVPAPSLAMHIPRGQRHAAVVETFFRCEILATTASVCYTEKATAARHRWCVSCGRVGGILPQGA